MRNYVKILSFSFIITLLFNSCNNKLNILAPYKESISVYAILNPQEQFQFIRVNKIYLGEGNAYDMAQVHDSVNYPIGVLSATLEHPYNQTKIILKDTVLTTKSGAFNTSQNFFYTSTKLYTFGDYKLTIRNNQTNKTYTAQTTMIDSIIPSVFQPLKGKYYCACCPPPNICTYTCQSNCVIYDPVDPFYTSYFVDFSLPGTSRTVRFRSIPNSKVYSLTMQLHYEDSLNTGVKVARSVDYKLVDIYSKTYNGAEDMAFNFYSSEMYAHYYNEIMKTESTDILFRKFVKLDFIVYAASRDYYDFLQISAPSTTVVQDKPVYTNISEGFGIFAVRSRFHIQKQLSTNFIDYMAENAPMCRLRFLKSTGLPSQVCN